MAMLARSESRDGYAVRVLAVHTTEGSGTAESLRDAAWWTGSSHALADERGKLLTPADGCVPYDRASWTLRSGNRWSENIELVGFAKWKRGDWLARPKLLDACARWLADRSKARDIPLVKLSPKEYAAGRSGVIGHVDHTQGYNDGTHWDPGPDFPYDVVLAKAAAYAGGSTPSSAANPGGLFMSLTADEERRILGTADKLAYFLDTMKANTDYIPAMANAVSEIHWGVLDEQQGLRVAVSGLYAKLAQGGPAITAEDIAALIPDSLAEQVAQKLADRLAS